MSEHDGGAARITPQTLYPKRSTTAWLLLGSSAFVVVGVWMGREEGWIGYACAAFFGLCAAVAIVHLVPGASSLSIDGDGLSCRSLFRRWSVRWDDIDRFYPVAIRQGGVRVHQMVGWDYLPGRGPPGRGRRLSSAIAGCEGALPDTYGMTAQELADLLNRLLDESRAR
ncbi:MAG TPA: hypothetical protein VFU21_20130 [Kofleriaceae bacterium]|nr:hypothetical protein [Kofleriaceae bacterium]